MIDLRNRKIKFKIDITYSYIHSLICFEIQDMA